MESFTVGALKTKFSEVVEGVKKGHKYAVSYGKSKKTIAIIVPSQEYYKQTKIIGSLEGKGKVKFSENFKMTEEELLGL